MKRITILLILLFFIVLFGCYTKTKETDEYIDYDTYLDLHEDYINLVDKSNNLEKDLTKELNKCRIDNIMIEEKWKSYLWKESNYWFYPTGCENPKKTFTMCRYGCDIKFYCDSNSMNPLFYCNSKLTLADCTKYSIGDIVLIENKDKELQKYDYLIHQIVDISSNKITTKGFNSYGVDSFKSSIFSIKGKVIKIEY